MRFGLRALCTVPVIGGKKKEIEPNRDGPVWRTRTDKNDGPRRGINVEVGYVRKYQEQWDKITQSLQ
jgi:hypothetical protein